MYSVLQIEIEDVKRVYSLFLDQSRSAQFLKDYQDQFMFSEIGEHRPTGGLLGARYTTGEQR